MVGLISVAGMTSVFLCLLSLFFLTCMGSMLQLCLRMARVELRSVQGGTLVEDLMKAG